MRSRPGGAAGSSPHTRGALARNAQLVFGKRIIPAYAGSTFPSLASTSARRDHPRIRGEHGSDLAEAHGFGGSSPHTRGAHRLLLGEGGEFGIIPAYAGSTRRLARGRRPEPDHPRIRGEHDAAAVAIEAPPGSSPHTRGARDDVVVRLVHVGIIPAYAGSTSPDEAIPMKRGDHPRIRGEHKNLPNFVFATWGSSPHTRGARRPSSARPESWRIIPAYAGSTQSASSAPCRLEDHPRIRGEHTWKSLQYQGSPS